MRRLYTLLDGGCVLLALAGGVALVPGAERPAALGEVHVRRGGARLAQDVRGGQTLTAEDPVGARVLAAVHAARQCLPPSLRPQVVVHLEPRAVTFAPLRGPVRVYASAGVIAVDGPFAALDRSVWLHELVHLAASGSRPGGAAGARLMTAVDEGAADFAAAVFGGTTVVGSVASGEARDLSAPPLVGDSEWAYLAVPSAPFDAHRLGWALASSLHVEGGSSEERAAFAADVVHSLASRVPFVTGDTPGAVLAEWTSRCPPRSRPALMRAVRRWIPPELFLPEGSS